MLNGESIEPPCTINDPSVGLTGIAMYVIIALVSVTVVGKIVITLLISIAIGNPVEPLNWITFPLFAA